MDTLETPIQHVTEEQSHNRRLINVLRGSALAAYGVLILNNYKDRRYGSQYGAREFIVLASSAQQAQQVVIDNAEAILAKLIKTKDYEGRCILSASHAVPIIPSRVRTAKLIEIWTSIEKEWFTPYGPMLAQLGGGRIVATSPSSPAYILQDNTG